MESAPVIVKSAVALLKSEAMFLVLSQLTGLRLHSLAPPDSDPDSDEESVTGSYSNSCLVVTKHR